MPAAAPRPSSGREGEGDRARDECLEPERDGETDRSVRCNRIAGKPAEGGTRRPGRHREDRHGDGECRHVCRHLLQRDRAARVRCRDREVETAATCLTGERGRQREDRPEPDEKGEVRAVVPGNEPAQRVDVHRGPVQPSQDRRHAGRQGRQIGPRRGGSVGAGHRGATGENDAADQCRDDDDAVPGISKRLGENAPEAIEPTVVGDERGGCRDRHASELNGHGRLPPRPRDRTVRGRSARGSVLGLRNRAGHVRRPP